MKTLPPQDVDVLDMRPSEIKDTIHALGESIHWISEQEQEIADLQAHVNELRIRCGLQLRK